MTSRTFSFNHGDDGHQTSPENPRTDTNAATPGMDNLGPSAVGGGISGIALGIANTHDGAAGTGAGTTGAGARAASAASGASTVADVSGGGDGYTGPPERGFNTTGAENPYVPEPPAASAGAGAAGAAPMGASAGSLLQSQNSYGTTAGGAPVGDVTDSSHQNLLEAQQPKPWTELNDGPYQRNSAYSGGDYPLFVNPDEIIDDGDDGIAPPGKTRGTPGGAAAAAGAGGATAGGILGFFGKKGPNYGPVPGGGGGGGGDAAGLEAGEKSNWLKGGAEAGSKKRGWLVGLALGFIVVGAIVGGAVGGILGNRSNKTREKDSIHSAKDDTNKNGDLNLHSSEIQSLLGNKDLHKVFPGVDYTPWGVQYPLCEEYPPSQNNVTRDMAVLSQLTNTVRLYGTDCNQTEMVLHAIDRLELKEMKLWLGVWVDSNSSTTDRQLSQLYDILDDTKDPSIFKGAIVGNEALFRAGSTKSEAQKNLIGYMDDVRKQLKKRNIDMPVATSDLGDDWNKDLAKAADMVMSNVHPFFAGVTVEEAASWTYTFWTSHDASLTKGTDKKQVISEVGWPSGGGNDCGSGNKCKSDTDGSVASVENMNKFMSDFVCQALENGTDYFWYVLSPLPSLITLYPILYVLNCISDANAN